MRELLNSFRTMCGWKTPEELERISREAESIREDLTASICGIREFTAGRRSIRQQLPTLSD